MVIEGILDIVIKNKRTICFCLKQQLLIYIIGEKRVARNTIVKAKEIGFFFICKIEKLVISEPIWLTAVEIEGSKVCTASIVYTHHGIRYQSKLTTQLCFCSSVIIDKMSKIDPKQFKSIDKQL